MSNLISGEGEIKDEQLKGSVNQAGARRERTPVYELMPALLGVVVAPADQTPARCSSRRRSRCLGDEPTSPPADHVLLFERVPVPLHTELQLLVQVSLLV